MTSGQREKKIIAVEFTSSAMKMVKVKSRPGEAELIEAVSVPLPLKNDPQEKATSWQEAISNLLSEENLGNEVFLLSVNDPQMCFSRFVIPKIPHKELTDTLKWRMKDELPYPAEEAVLDYRLFETSENKIKQYAAIVTALPKNVLVPFYRILPENLSDVFTPAFVPFTVTSLANSFSLSKQDLIVVIDMGHMFTEIAFYAEGKLSFSRKIAFAGFKLSQTLTNPLTSERGTTALTFEEAEQAKKDEELLDPTSQKIIAGKTEASKLFALIRPELEELSREITRSLDYYIQENGNIAARIFLTGGSSHLKGLNKFLEQSVGVPVYSIRLSEDIKIAEKLKNTDLNSFYRLISIAVDRRDSDSAILKTLKSAERVARSISYIQAALAACLIFLILSGGMLWRYFSVTQKTSDLRRQITNLKSGFSEAQKIQTIESKINRGVILASAILADEPYWDEVFRELSHVFPDNVVLTGFSYERDTYQLMGKILSSSQEIPISKILSAVEGPVFQKATLVNTQQGDGFISFTLRARAAES